MKLDTKVVEKVWGRSELPPALSRFETGSKLGEVWFDAPGRELPILVKWIFTSEKLSVQVHPTDAQARERGQPSGKEECWYILDAEPGATLGLGTKRPMTGEELRAAALDGSIEDAMDWKPTRAGDFWSLAPGIVHAIGAGVTLIEVQQNADITYRLYDYGRPRELHLDDGVAVSVAEPFPMARHSRPEPGPEPLVDGEHFRLWLRAGEGALDGIPTDQARWLMPIEGQARVGGESAGPGECLYAEAGAEASVAAGAKVLVAVEAG